MLLAVATLALLACSASAARQVSSHARGLAQFEKEAKFPFCKCKDYAPESSPYTLLPTNTSGVNSDNVPYGEFCFKLQYDGPSDTASECYTALEAKLDKLVFSIQPPCVPAFDSTGRYMTIDGKRKKDSWRIKNYPSSSALELYSLKLSAAANAGSTVCFRFAAPCNIPENLFTTTPATVSLMESSYHKCCPVVYPGLPGASLGH